ncbi:Os11g0215800 [Oryza sativa Japonica Group]|uniref:Os11g0215800 protein n=1 Tax=Oryza sativa subsp. japonica TaxID=39947 RepID=Q2R8U9_ORYSJ|nr:uncharacterized protein LOC112936837 [Oryza sativa Japonica Group]ABA92055.1 hypothetical protein LOC_Os11g10940 [Oryza sativa Japonica Group]BAT13215.1 Os11g0215800 [Oryza sativa Japonica Group]
MERRFLLLAGLLLATAAGEQQPSRTAMADHQQPAATAAPCDPLCISGAAAGATPEAMAAAAMAGGNESESALPPRQLDRPDSSGLPTTHQSWIYHEPVAMPYSTAPPAAISLVGATAAATAVFSTMLLAAAAAR